MVLIGALIVNNFERRLVLPSPSPVFNLRLVMLATKYCTLPNISKTCLSMKIIGVKASRHIPAMSDKCIPDILNMCPVPVRCNSTQLSFVNPALSPSSSARHQLRLLRFCAPSVVARS